MAATNSAKRFGRFTSLTQVIHQNEHLLVVLAYNTDPSPLNRQSTNAKEDVLFIEVGVVGPGPTAYESGGKWFSGQWTEKDLVSFAVRPSNHNDRRVPSYTTAKWW